MKSVIATAKLERLAGWKVPPLQDELILGIVLLSLHYGGSNKKKS